MFKSILFFVLIIQASKADLVDDAETSLNGLRQTTSDNLNGAFLEHTKMSLEVDTVSLDTKEAGLKAIKEKVEEVKAQSMKVRHTTPGRISACHKTLTKIQKAAADDLETCVNDQATIAVDLIYSKSSGLADSTLRTIYDEEKEIVYCGRQDDVCLNDVISVITDKIAGVPTVINDEVELDRQAVEEQIELIKACATQAAERAKGFAKRCVL